MEVRCRRSKTSPQNRQVHGGYSSPFRSRGKRWVCPLNLCFQNSHILETSQLLTNKGLPCLLMLETRKRGSQRFATKTPYSVTEWRSSKDLNLGPTMLNVNRRRGGTGKQEAATLQLTGELLELVLTQIQFANIDENPETQTRKRGETNRSKGEARNIVEQGCEGDSKWSVGRKFLGLIALALDLDEGFFENIGALNDPTAVVRLLRYPGGLLKDDVLGSMNAKRTNNLPRELRAYRFPPILAGDYIGSVHPDDLPGSRLVNAELMRQLHAVYGECLLKDECWNFVVDHFKGARMLFLSEGLTHADLVAMAQEDHNLDMNTYFSKMKTVSEERDEAEERDETDVGDEADVGEEDEEGDEAKNHDGEEDAEIPVVADAEDYSEYEKVKDEDEEEDDEICFEDYKGAYGCEGK
ncbi:hypothetical protein DY000_02054071 [Brassica cretica]|uniref:Uncharacterized protein n=1 Tax=Brassica cretica TaxID=69181 RepID=A0ABQ7A615_BRACR|nr:hypothetical protein DY000_02054071 [Brassica cretica]